MTLPRRPSGKRREPHWRSGLPAARAAMRARLVGHSASVPYYAFADGPNPCYHVERETHHE